jgi:hypothetical protein
MNCRIIMNSRAVKKSEFMRHLKELDDLRNQEDLGTIFTTLSKKLEAADIYVTKNSNHLDPAFLIKVRNVFNIFEETLEICRDFWKVRDWQSFNNAVRYLTYSIHHFIKIISCGDYSHDLDTDGPLQLLNSIRSFY